MKKQSKLFLKFGSFIEADASGNWAVFAVIIAIVSVTVIMVINAMS